jgi:hypothetical protein
MVIDDLYVVRISLNPPEAQPPLVVQPDTVLSLAVTLESLQSISGRHPQVNQPGRGIQELHSIESLLLNTGGQSARTHLTPDPLGLLAGKTHDYRIGI